MKSRLPSQNNVVALMGLDYFLLALALYWGAADSYFRGDDFFLLFPFNWTDFKAPWFGSFVKTEMIMPFYRPVFSSIFSGLFALFQLDPVGYHLVVISLHASVCYLMFLLMQRLGLSRFSAWLGALIFLLLPSHTQIVVHLINMAEILWVFWGLLSVHFLLLWKESQQRRWFLFHIFCLVLSFGSKEGAIGLPLLLLLVCWYLYKPGDSLFRLLRLVSPSFLILALYLIVRGAVFGSQQGYSSYVHGMKAIVLFDHLLLRISSLLLAPSWGETIDGILSGTCVVPILLLIIIIVGPRWVKFALLWLIAAFIPYLTYPVYAERFSYAAGLSLAILCGFLFHIMEQNCSIHRFLRMGLILVLVISLLGLTLYRVNIWYPIADQACSQGNALRSSTGILRNGTILTIIRAKGKGFDDYYEFRPKPMLTIFPEMYRYPTFFDILRVHYYSDRVSFIPASSFLLHDFPLIEQHYILEERLFPDNHVYFHRVDIVIPRERDAYLRQMRNR